VGEVEASAASKANFRFFIFEQKFGQLDPSQAMATVVWGAKRSL
jgi:hypothetical protein